MGPGKVIRYNIFRNKEDLLKWIESLPKNPDPRLNLMHSGSGHSREIVSSDTDGIKAAMNIIDRIS